MTSYARELWEMVGLTPLTAPDLRADHFFALVKEIDRLRTTAKNQAPQG